MNYIKLILTCQKYNTKTVHEFTTSGLKNTIQTTVSNNSALKTDLLVLFWIKKKTQQDELYQVDINQSEVHEYTGLQRQVLKIQYKQLFQTTLP